MTPQRHPRRQRCRGSRGLARSSVVQGLRRAGPWAGARGSSGGSSPPNCGEIRPAVRCAKAEIDFRFGVVDAVSRRARPRSALRCRRLGSRRRAGPGRCRRGCGRGGRRVGGGLAARGSRAARRPGLRRGRGISAMQDGGEHGAIDRRRGLTGRDDRRDVIGPDDGGDEDVPAPGGDRLAGPASDAALWRNRATAASCLADTGAGPSFRSKSSLHWRSCGVPRDATLVVGRGFPSYAAGVSVPSQPRPLLSKEDEAAERAARVRAMLSRWEKSGDGDDPDWDVDDVEPISLRRRDEGGAPNDG